MITFDDTFVNPFTFKDTVTVPVGTVYFDANGNGEDVQLTTEPVVVVVNSAFPGVVMGDTSSVVQSEDEVDRRHTGVGYDVSVSRVVKVTVSVTAPSLVTYDGDTGKETVYIVTEALLTANNKPVEYTAPVDYRSM